MRCYKWLIGGVVILVLPILLVGCVAKSEYEALQEEKTSILMELEATQLDLTNIQTNLSISLEEKSILEAELEKMQLNLSVIQSNYEILQKELREQKTSLNIEIESLEKQLNLYKETYGKVFSEVQPFYLIKAGTMTNLINNERATHPTLQQLKNFLSQDKTDLGKYIDEARMCGYFAEKLHNNAEETGIRSAYVILRLEGGSIHALNAFKTTDSGLVFIDSTGIERRSSPPYGWSYPTNPSWDRIVTIEKGEEAVVKNLFPERATLTTLPGFVFDTWEQEWYSFGIVHDIEIYW